MLSLAIVYPAAANSPLHTMLTDTYTAPLFFREFASQPERALRWSGLRHDSGDPIEFARLAKRTWQEIIQASKNSEASLEGKKVIFSDGLDVDNALRIWKNCEEIGIDGTLESRRHEMAFCAYQISRLNIPIRLASFGIGTYFTNDFHLVNDTKTKSKPLNMVIKLRRVDDLECIKLSDDKGKWTGDYHEVLRSRDILGLGEEKVDQNVRAYGITG
jgi:nicotinate phosphoribosyltransferase